MKKLYTLALSALLAGTATAGELSLQTPQLRTLDFKGITTELQTVQAGAEAFAARGVRMAAQQAPIRVTESDIVDKQYQLEGYGRLFGEDTQGLEVLGVPEIIKENGQLKYGPFLFEGLYFNASFDAATMTLTIPAGQSVTFTEETDKGTQSVDLTIYNYSFEDQQAHDIVFTYYPEERLFFYEAGVDAQNYYTECIVLAQAAAQVGSGVYGQLFVAYNFMVNSVMAESEVDDQGNIGDSQLYNIYVEQKGDKIVIDNMFNFGFSAHPEFTVDAQAKTLSATRPVLYQGSDGTITMLGVDDEGYTTDEVLFSQNASTDAFIFQAAAVALTDGSQYQPAYLPMFRIPFNPYAGAGVQGVAVDNANAPVEYFNLQGVRVANPENGLYIRRQGNKVEKIIIR